MGIVFGLSLLGIFATFVGIPCVGGHLKTEADRKLFMVPLMIIGVVGYLLIALTTFFSFATVNHILVYSSGLFTIYLMVKAYQIKFGCPVCFAIWILNAAMVAAVLLGK